MEKVNLKQFPPKAKQGVLFLIGAWAFLIISQAAFYGTISLIQLTIGSFLCILVYSLKNWGRIICIIYNVLLIGNSLYTLYMYVEEGMPHPIPYGIHAISIILLATATYLLLHKETRQFFKSPSPTPVAATGTGIGT
ncbi:MAG: hypothetical protein JXB42_08395 [Deltaproteobacteria bacterium]|nr:hypothetical protein [Deltaproteobacteria bacterium]